MTVTAYEERFVGEGPRHPAFATNNKALNRFFPQNYVRVSPDDCPCATCRDARKRVACCYLDKLPSGRLWCLRFDGPIVSGKNAPKRSVECMVCKGR